MANDPHPAQARTSSTARHQTPHTTLIAFTLTVLLFSIVAAWTLNPPRHFMRRLHRNVPKPLIKLVSRIPITRYVVAEPSDLAVAVRSFADYSFAQQRLANSRYAAWQRMSARHRLMGHKLKWTEKLNAIEDAIEDNARVTDELAALGMELAHQTGDVIGLRSRFQRQDGRVVEVLKHFVRDWSEEGKRERDVLFPPILDALRYPRADRSYRPRALVPGSGLGRMAYEIAELGYETDANDYSHFMNLGARLVFNRTVSVNQHSVKPWIHNLSHQRSTINTTRTNRFPDVLPRNDAPLRFVPGDFLQLNEDAPYDAVISLFFIDTASNLLDYLEKIWRLLKPGGTWINEGPLLYYGNPAMALPLDDVIALAKLVGFEIEKKETIENVNYTADAQDSAGFFTIANSG
ncbi:hypothetical protein OIV83_000335 [Microbotryomycetes sp. JL201]|nr:hypothetical protein OIV83_000335 [Microbotryomycetes sp. JL201]